MVQVKAIKIVSRLFRLLPVLETLGGGDGEVAAAGFLQSDAVSAGNERRRPVTRDYESIRLRPNPPVRTGTFAFPRGNEQVSRVTIALGNQFRASANVLKALTRCSKNRKKLSLARHVPSEDRDRFRVARFEKREHQYSGERGPSFKVLIARDVKP